MEVCAIEHMDRQRFPPSSLLGSQLCSTIVIRMSSCYELLNVELLYFFEPYQIFEICQHRLKSITRPQLIPDWKRKICGATNSIEICGAISILEIFGAISILEMFGAISILEMFGAISILEMFGAISILEIFGATNSMEICGAISILEIFGAISILEIFGATSILEICDFEFSSSNASYINKEKQSTKTQVFVCLFT